MTDSIQDAVSSGDLNEIRKLIQLGQDPNAIDEFGSALVHIAAQAGRIDVIKLLAESGADLDQVDGDSGATALHQAADGEDIDVMRALLACGANVNARGNDGDSPLSLVAGYCSATVAQVLIDAGADPNAPGRLNRSAIDRANERKRPEGRQVQKILNRKL